MQVGLNDYQYGAALATALINTAPEVSNNGDRIADAAALSRFLTEHDVPLTAGHQPPTAEDVRAVHGLRAVLRALITVSDPIELATRAGELATSAGTGPTLRPDRDGHWQWQVHSRPGAALADELALLTATAVLAVLRTLGADRFRCCASPNCAGVFIDTSRSGRRRYCEPQVCGNRINVAAYRARRRTDRDNS